MRGGAVALLAQRRLLADPHVVAADDAVVVALAHPVEQLAHALDRQRVGHLQVLEEPREALEAAALLLVVEPLLDERVEVEVLGGRAGGQHHQRAADGLRIAGEQGRGAVAGELGGAEPLEQRVADRHQRQPGQQRQALREVQQDHQRGLVEDVVGVDVRRLVREHRALPVGVEQRDELGVEDDDRPPGADRHRVRERPLRQVEVGDVGEVQRVEDLAVEHPDLRELLLAQPYRGPERDRPQRALVAELDELAHDLVEIGHPVQRRRRGAVGRMLVGAGGDPLEAIGADGERHGPHATGRG